MLRYLTLTLTLTLMLMHPWALADSDRVDHYEGLGAEDLETALAHLAEYRTHLADVLVRGPLLATDLNEVHQLTYTLENALERLAVDVHALAELLEVVHVASEQADAVTVSEEGKAWLEATRPFQR